MKRILTFALLAFVTIVGFANPMEATTTLAKGDAMKMLLQREALSMKMAANKQVTETATNQTNTLDTVELVFKSFYDDPIYIPVEIVETRNGGLDTIGGDWLITLKNDRYQFNFDFYGGTPESPEGTYTVDDLDLMYCWATIPAAPNNSSYPKVCNLTIKKEKIGGSTYKYILDAVIVTTFGVGGEENGIFKIHAEHEIVLASIHYDVAILNCVVTPEDDRFNIAGNNDTMDVNLTFFTELGVIGYYSHNLLDYETVKLVHRGTSYDIMELEGVVVTAELKTGGLAYVAMVEILAESATDTTFFNIAMEAPIIPTENIDIFCSNLMLNVTMDAVVAEASNSQYEIYAGYNDVIIRDSANYVGTSNSGNAMVYITEVATEKIIGALTTNLTIVGTKKKGYTLKAQVLGDDHKSYNLTLTNVLPDKMDTVNVDFPDNSKAMFDIDELGLIELLMDNSNGDYSVSFDILNIDQIMGGSFTKSDLFLDDKEVTTYFIKHTANGDVPVDFVQFEGEIKQKHDSTFIKAMLIGFDSTVYNISMYYTVPTPTDTISYTFNENNTFFTNALPQGIFILEGMTDDGQAMCNIQVNRTRSVEGTFICDGKFVENQFEPSETYVGIYEQATKKYTPHYMQKGEMTVTIDKEKLLIVATASFICDDAKLYQLNLTAPYDIPHLPDDAEDEGASYTFGMNTEVIVMDDYLESDGYIEYILYVENPFNMLDLIFFIDETDPDIIIPEGVYPFGAYGSKNHVLASRGMVQDPHTGEIYPLPSYYQTLDELSQPYGYFLVAGQVTVEKVDGHIVLNVDAINSNYLPVKILYDPSITAVENIETDSVTSVQKQIINGQLFIIRNGETFSITGLRVK
ncbi:MAG: hypothetical protein IJV81_03750 [Paludibacteraceae bacterium]|nr:hypothetical protein [Paludibacteraceae bacterium]